VNIDQIVLIINELGYPVLMTFGMGYFIWYVWQYVTKKLKPTISASHKMLINLLDQIRMLDNDLIRLQQKVNTVIEYRKQQENNEKNNNTKSTRK
jgi:hypothetical protein|tara:strand:- start:36 stop:320 length:285 start_codon:yes stop_codon:yes gene_type:complete